MITSMHQTFASLKSSLRNTKEYQIELLSHPEINHIKELVLNYQIPNHQIHDVFSGKSKSAIQHMRTKLMNCEQLTKIIEERIHVGKIYTFYREIFRVLPK